MLILCFEVSTWKHTQRSISVGIIYEFFLVFRFPLFDSHLTWYALFSERDELQKDIEAICLQQSGVAGTVNSYMQARRWVNIQNHIVTYFSRHNFVVLKRSKLNNIII